MVSLIATSIEVDISIPSLPDISNHFSISEGVAQMTISINFLGFCLSSMLYGPLSEGFGRRKIMIFGNSIMLIGAFGCTLSSSIESLLFFLFIQGVGASASAVAVFAIVADTCKGAHATQIIGKINSLLTMTMSIAPIIGSLINQTMGWRGNYGAIFLISLLSWILLYFFLPETKSKLETINSKKIFQNYLKLFRSYSFILTSLVPSTMFAGYMSFITCAPFLYMETFKLPMLNYAVHQGIIIGCFAIISNKADKICSYLGEKKCVKYGIIMPIISGILLFTLGIYEINHPMIITFSMSIGSIGVAISYPIIFTKSFEIFPDIGGTTSSAIIGVRMLVTSIFVAWISFIYDGNLFTVATILLITNILTASLYIPLVRAIKFSD